MGAGLLPNLKMANLIDVAELVGLVCEGVLYGNTHNKMTSFGLRCQADDV
jgi:hypothetical protein